MGLWGPVILVLQIRIPSLCDANQVWHVLLSKPWDALLQKQSFLGTV